MDRLRRLFWNGLTVLSLLLCVTTIGLLIRSAYLRHSAPDYFAIDTHRWGNITLVAGQYNLFLSRWDILPDSSGWRYLSSEWNPVFKTYVNVFGFRVEANDPAADHRRLAQSIIVPQWLACSLFALLPLLRVFSNVRSRRRQPAHNSHPCPICGYDLRATPTRFRECGTAMTAPPAAAR